ncbi:MAG TPA: 50S ribosomal protein L9 [Acidimicrobiales bacterium]|nr:50S ribosomal protein L9 [Acidimicrobiales bacterium]
MKVVLRSDIDNVGKRGDLVEVADGFARNLLIPSGQAIAATAGIQQQADAMRRRRDLADAKDREAAEVVARTLVPAVIQIKAKAGAEGKLFGSVTPADIVEAIKAQTGIELDRRKLGQHEPIKNLGTHEIPVQLHSDVKFQITLEVASS